MPDHNRFNFPTVFPCGRGVLPGSQGPGAGGSEPTTTPVILIADPPDPPDPPIIPPNIPSPGGGGDPPVPDQPRPPRPGDGTPSTPTGGPAFPTGPATGGRPSQGGPTTGPTGPTAGGPLPPLPVATGGTTGGSSFFKCAATGRAEVCDGEQNLPLSQVTNVISFEFGCIPCSPNIVNPDGTVVADPQCIFTSQEACASSCITRVPTGLFCEPGVGVVFNPPQTSISEPTTSTEVRVAASEFRQVDQPTSPSISLQVNDEATRIIANQQAMNATVITANELIEDEGFRNSLQGFTQPSLFDPNLNFFRTEPNTTIELVPNRSYLDVFKDEIAIEIAEILSISNSNRPWDEVTLQNLSDDKLIESLAPILLNSFQYIRYPGGEPVGVSTLLNVIRRHILEGTMNEFDPNFYIEAAEAQINQKFQVLEKPENEEDVDRLSIKYLTNSDHTYQTDKPTNFRNFQVNRVRPLNEDINMKVAVKTLEDEILKLAVPNEGINVEMLSAVVTDAVPSLGAPDKINIGNGGGYYITSRNLESVEAPIPTENLLQFSYYAVAPERAKILNMLGVDSSITITASSNLNQHEFTPDYPAVSEIKPLFFAINLDSVSGNSIADSLVESYSATYSLLTASSDIQTHLNNNALNTPMLSVDYRDKLFQYIYETSSFTLSLNDFNLKGFKDKAYSGTGSRFVRNIPFGVVITPVRGGKFNPFNGRSKLIEHGDIHVRSMSVRPALDTTIDGTTAPMFDYYSLNLRDGVNRVGVGESEDTQNIGYSYDESKFTETFYESSSNSYSSLNLQPPSAQGVAYMLREVIDYLSSTYSATTLTWYDIFSRMPVTRFAEMFYGSDRELIQEIANGFRGGIIVENVEVSPNNSYRVISEDSKTVITTGDRLNITKSRI